MKIVFWGLVVLDALGIGLFYLLGLAAAGSSRSNPLQVALVMLVLPVTLLGVAVLMFLKAGSTPVRLFAVLIAAAPLVLLVGGRAIAQIQFNAGMNEEGEMTFFRSGPMREIAEAIGRNDTSTVASLVKQVKLNQKGLAGMTLLGMALKQLETTPHEHEVLRILLDAGADPNQESQYEFPLSTAMLASDSSGPEPVKMLLDAGANSNQLDTFGSPVFFLAIGKSPDLRSLTLLLDRGADINALSKQGATILFAAANTSNWKAALLLLQRGADWKLGKSVNGMPFENLVIYRAQPDNADPALAEVKQFITRR